MHSGVVIVKTIILNIGNVTIKFFHGGYYKYLLNTVKLTKLQEILFISIRCDFELLTFNAHDSLLLTLSVKR